MTINYPDFRLEIILIYKRKQSKSKILLRHKLKHLKQLLLPVNSSFFAFYVSLNYNSTPTFNFNSFTTTQCIWKSLLKGRDKILVLRRDICNEQNEHTKMVLTSIWIHSSNQKKNISKYFIKFIATDSLK